MESADCLEEVSPHSELRTSARCDRVRPRSATMIPYMVNNDKIIPSLPHPTTSFPGLEYITPSPNLAPARLKEPSVQMDKEISCSNSALTATSPSMRSASPFASYPFVTDPHSLQVAVSENASRIFEAVQSLVNDRDALRADLTRTSAELQSVTEDLANTRIDHKAARGRYEELFRVASAKQAILWKYIESLHSQLAAAKGQPVSSSGAGNGLSMAMSTSSGPGMGIAMENWISEGVDGCPGPRHGEEGSEQGTDRSSWSTDDSLGAKSLDPNAQAFIPPYITPEEFRTRSPEKITKTRSPGKDWDLLASSTPTRYNTSYAVQDPSQDQPRGRQRQQAQPFPGNPLQPGPAHSIIALLPPRWYGICPYSLANAAPCPLGVNCQFIPLCPNYNDENGSGCGPFNKGGPTACRFAHEHRFCEQAVSRQPEGCVWEGNVLGRHPATMEQVKKKREIHMRVKAHKSTCDVAEWEARLLLLSMREAHGRGIFNGH
ncbi:hypothetical protein BKA64DRAFT_707270 [Cadophora sp. MPI-SDFR-AT-0126]|nr:hypothetical protein BKA64DRAFT_707270 [Leotiomycetes sp. MPI-SDFR-AT-0126]